MQLINKLKTIIKKHLYKKGIKTNRQIIVFESDDWGATRTSNRQSLEQFLKKYPNAKRSIDCVESLEDVDKLKEVLLKHKDSKGHPAKFTLNFAMANPDFEKIKAANYQAFYHKRIDEDENYKTVLSSIKDGIDKGCFQTQLHTREHLNKAFLLDDLSSNKMVKDAFDLGIIGVTNEIFSALDTLNCPKSETNEALLTDAVRYFIDVFGFTPKTFIAPCYVWSQNDELILKNLGIKAMQGKLQHQNIPLARGKHKHVFHTFGSYNKKSKLQYFYRNCVFEQALNHNAGKTDEEIINKILNDIDFAFSCNKPAIICTHRINYTSGIDAQSRNAGLKLLDKLLYEVEQRYSNIEFLSSDELYDMFNKNGG